MINDLTVSILGLGYVGLPTTLLIAQKGFKVIGYDISSQLIDDLFYKKNIIQMRKMLINFIWSW